MKASALIRTVIISLCSLTLMNASALGKPKAGFMESEVSNFAGAMWITVWYPTSTKDKSPSAYDFYLDGGALQNVEEEWAQAGATRDATIKGGRFPLIVNVPGGLDLGPGGRWNYYPVAELLAANGYIVVTPGRNTAQASEQGPLWSSLITHMLNDHPLRNSIDATKIGARGLSYGGLAVASLAGGDVFGNPPDTRIKGIIIDEGWGVCSFTNCELPTIPVMLRDGSPLGLLPPEPGDVGDMAPEFAAFANAVPRFLVTLKDVTHWSFTVGTCQISEASRQLSLIYQQTNLGAIIEDEPRNFTYFFTAPAVGDNAGLLTSILWNADALRDAGNGTGTLGSGGDFCRAEYGGPLPVTPAVNAPILEEQTMIETLYALDLGFWKTVFGNGKSKKTKLDKAVKKLDNIKSFVKVTE